MQQAAQIRALAEAEAEKAARIGIGEAIAIEEQVRAYGGPKFQVTQQVMNRFAHAIETAQVDVVPKIVMGGGAGQNNGGVLETLLGVLLSERLGEPIRDGGQQSPEMQAFRTRVRAELLADLSRANGEVPTGS